MGVLDEEYRMRAKKRRMRSRGSEKGNPWDIEKAPGEDLYSRTKIARNIADKKVEGAQKEAPEEGAPAQTTGQAAAASAGGQIAAGGAQSGSVGDIAAGGLIASGNPYAIGAGAGLMVLSASQKRKQKHRENVYNAKVARIERQQKMLSTFLSNIRGATL